MIFIKECQHQNKLMSKIRKMIRIMMNKIGNRNEDNNKNTNPNNKNKNANEIAEKARALYDKFVTFVADLDEVGSKIDSSKKSFEKAHNKLLSGRGNLVKRAEALRELGAKTSKKQKTELLAKIGEVDTEGLPDKKTDLEQDKKTHH